jgi:hypothetical protein
MVLKFGQIREEDVTALIAKKNYAKAIEVIRAQLQGQRADSRLRLRLADVLVASGKGREAVAVLLSVADEHAREGFVQKAISILKRIQKIDPGRRDIDARLAGLIRETQDSVPSAGVPSSAPAFEIGMEEIGFEPLAGGTLSVPAPEPPIAAGEPEIDLETAPVEAPFSSPVAASTVVDRDLIMEGEEEEAEPVPSAPIGLKSYAGPALDLGFDFAATPEPFALDLGPPPGTGMPAEPPAAEAEALPLLALEPEAQLQDAAAVSVEPEFLEPDLLEPQLLAPESGGQEWPDENPMTDAAFADELLSILEGAFPSADVPRPTPAGGPETAPGRQIVVSPLFKDFSVDEMVAVIQGLKLLTFEPGDMVITQGDAGSSLYMLASGSVKAFVRNAAGQQVQVGELTEGAFFGEMSILTGKPRSATIIAATRCELLELDRPTLDSIVAAHPHVMKVLEEFCAQRLRRQV